MRFITSSAAALVAIAATVSAHNSSAVDCDGSVWAKLNAAKKSRSILDTFKSRSNNRPAKRQDGWSPPSDMAGALKEVWDHYEETYSNGDLYLFKNYGWDQLIANNGQVNVCVRWESTVSVTAEQRAQVATVYAAQYQKWFEWLYGYDSFPYTDIKVNVVGWAVSDASVPGGSTDDTRVYTGFTAENAPECDPACGRYYHTDGDYSSCPGGADVHYDQSLWLTEGMSGGTGGDWGQRIGREYFMGALGSENVHILEHEMGHTYGLDDFYDWTPTGQTSFVMLAGSAAEVTDFDGWMLRNWWHELSRNRDGWRTGTSTGGDGDDGSATTTTAAASQPAETTTTPAEGDEDDTANPTTVADTPAATTTTAPAQETAAPTVGNGNGNAGTTSRSRSVPNRGSGDNAPTATAGAVTSRATCTRTRTRGRSRPTGTGRPPRFGAHWGN